MFKSILTVLLLLSLVNCQISYAGVTQLNNKFFDELEAGKTVLAMRKDNAKVDFENDFIKVKVNGNMIKAYHWRNKDISPKEFLSIHRNAIYTLKNKEIIYCSIIATQLEIKNKTNEYIYINPENTIVSIGSYQGKPIIEGTRFFDGNITRTVPVILEPQQVKIVTLYRNDFTFHNQIKQTDESWSPPCDLSLGENVMGNGCLLLAIGQNDIRYINMYFYREIDKNSIEKYIVK